MDQPQPGLTAAIYQAFLEIWRIAIGGVGTLAAWGLARLGHRMDELDKRIKSLELFRAEQRGRLHEHDDHDET